MKQITWWPHALERLAERGINRKLVQTAIEYPDQIIITGKQKIIHKRYHDVNCQKEYLLRIFVDEHSGNQIVRSLYRTSKINKYWRYDL